MGDIRTVAILGAGSTGTQLARLCAQQGFGVLIIDADDDALCSAMLQVADSLQNAGGSALRRGRLIATGDPAALRDAELAIDTSHSGLLARRRLLSRADTRMATHGVLATHGDERVISMLAGAIGRPDRFIGLRFFDSDRLLAKVRVVPGPLTSASTLRLAEAFALRLSRR